MLLRSGHVDLAGRAHPLIRISPDGKAQWQIPVTESLGDAGNVPEIAAAGRLLAIVTPPIPDPVDPEANLRPRCVLIDPATNTVEYSGPLTRGGA